MTLSRWTELGAVIDVEPLGVSETILTVWDHFSHAPMIDPATRIGSVLYASEVEAFREWIVSFEAVRDLYDDGLVIATLKSEDGIRFIRACGECWAAMIENGIPWTG